MGRMRRALQQRLPVAAGAATLTVFLAAVILLPKTTSAILRDSAFDIELAGDQWLRRPAPSDLKVIVVDIDRASIDALGTCPWPRETMARIVEAVAIMPPAAIAMNVLFANPRDRHAVPRANSVKASPPRLGSGGGGLRCRAMRCSGSCRWQHGVASPARYPRSMASRDGLTAAGWRARWCCLAVPRRSSAACARRLRTR